MKIPLRIIRQRRISGFSEFSIFEGVKTLFHNLKMLFTQRITGGGGGWHKSYGKTENITDYSLQEVDGELKFIKTPISLDGYQTVLEITQDE